METLQLPFVTVYGPDGTLAEGGLSGREAQTVAALDRALHAAPGSAAAYPQACLERVECMRGIPETAEGHFYLCYRSEGRLYEFWGNLGEALSVSLEEGLVTVREADLSAARAESPRAG